MNSKGAFEAVAQLIKTDIASGRVKPNQKLGFERSLSIKNYYDVILNSIYDGIVAIDTEGNITLFNDAAGRMLGYDPNKAIGKHIKQLIPNTRLLEVLTSGVPELRQKHEIGGKIFLVSRTPIFSKGGTLGAMAVFQNITPEKELLSELVDIKQFLNILELILDNAYVGIVFCDPSGIIRFMNRTFEELLEIRKNEAIGEHITKYFPDSRLPIVIKTGKPEIGWQYNFRGKRTLIVNRIPIKKGNDVMGAIAQCIFKDVSELKELVNKLAILETKINSYKKEITNLFVAKYSFEDIIGQSESIINVKNLAFQYARTDGPVLIIGETGVGKELFAHAIHRLSGRFGGPLVSINCASMPNELMESELFGYAPGAFTGAHPKGKKGKIELADAGTLFLDEIGDLPLSAQAKLLRVLEEKRVERIGGIQPIEVDFRLVAATNQDLNLLMKEKNLRADLYYRLGTMTLFVPPLRGRTKDIQLLVNHFVHQLAGNQVRVSDQAINVLMTYLWPGNIRELKNVIERALSLIGENNIIEIHNLPIQLVEKSTNCYADAESLCMALNDVISEQGAKTIQTALHISGGNKVKASKLLRISRSVLYSKMKRYGISP